MAEMPNPNQPNRRGLVDSTYNDWLVPGQQECEWRGVICVDNVVTEIRFASLELEGRIPVEIGLLANLTVLELSNNAVRGNIPEHMYLLTNLEEIYLYKNNLQGNISPAIGNLNRLRKLHMSHNQITGPIPLSMRSQNEIRSYEYINFYSNRMTGTIPESLRWRKLFFLDLGRNSFSGTLPYDLGERFVALRSLHLSHNNFVGTLPDSYINAGNGRVTDISIEYNQLTGAVPGDHWYKNVLLSFTLHENLFSDRLDKDTCKQSVFHSGEMVELKADCAICDCDDFCGDCNP